MQLRTQILKEGELYQHDIVGLIDVPHVKLFVEHFWQTHAGKFAEEVNIIWNCLDCEFPMVNYQDAKELAESMRGGNAVYHPGKTAIVIKSGFMTHVANVFVDILGKDYVRTPRVFNDLKRAFDFLSIENG